MKDIVYFLIRDHDRKEFLIPKYPEKLKIGRDRKRSDVVTKDPIAGPLHFFIYQNKQGNCYLADTGLGTVVHNTLVQGDITRIEDGSQITFKDGKRVLYKLQAYTQLQEEA